MAFGDSGEGPTRSSSSGVWGVCCLHGALLLGAQDWGSLVSLEVHFYAHFIRNFLTGVICSHTRKGQELPACCRRGQGKPAIRVPLGHPVHTAPRISTWHSVSGDPSSRPGEPIPGGQSALPHV